MASTSYYCCVQEWGGEWKVCSYGGRNLVEERRNANSCNRRVVYVGKSYEAARAKQREMIDHGPDGPKAA